RVERLAVLRVDEARDRLRVGEDGVDEFTALGVGLPDAYARVDAGGGEVLAVGTPGDGVDPVGRVAEGVEALARLDVPHLHRPVGGRRGEQLPLRVEGEAVDG